MLSRVIYLFIYFGVKHEESVNRCLKEWADQIKSHFKILNIWVVKFEVEYFEQLR